MLISCLRLSSYVYKFIFVNFSGTWHFIKKILHFCLKYFFLWVGYEWLKKHCFGAVHDSGQFFHKNTADGMQLRISTFASVSWLFSQHSADYCHSVKSLCLVILYVAVVCLLIFSLNNFNKFENLCLCLCQRVLTVCIILVPPDT